MAIVKNPQSLLCALHDQIQTVMHLLTNGGVQGTNVFWIIKNVFILSIVNNYSPKPTAVNNCFSMTTQAE